MEYFFMVYENTIAGFPKRDAVVAAHLVPIGLPQMGNT